ncbi:MAG: MFS transporter [Spongiibacteraceae bacterium]
MLKFTLLSISFLTVFGSAAIAPALSEIAQAFPNIPSTQIKALLTAPAFAMLLLSPNIGRLSHRFGQKPLLLFGLGCYLLGGLGGAFTPDYYSLFACRVVLGMGIGILMPMASSLIAENYNGKERLQLMGWASSATNFFGIVGNLAVGFLALYSWRYGMIVYTSALLTVVLVIRNIPADPPRETGKRPQTKLPLQTYLWGLAMFVFMLGIYAVPVNLALFVVESGLGGPSESGMAMSCLSVAAILAGLLGSRARSVCGDYFVIIILSIMTAGYLLLLTTHSLIGLAAALLVIGLGSGSLLPYIIYCATSSVQGVTPINAMGVIATAASLGQFATPIILDSIAFMLGDTSTHFVFQIVATCCGGVIVLMLIRKLFSGSLARKCG